MDRIIGQEECLACPFPVKISERDAHVWIDDCPRKNTQQGTWLRFPSNRNHGFHLAGQRCHEGRNTQVYNKTYDATWSNVSKSYSTTKNYQLGKAGRYTFRATYKCYKNGSLLETIKCDPLYKSF